MRGNFLSTFALVFCLGCLQGVVWSQAAASLDEYALYEKAEQETDAAKRQALLLEFVQKYPKSALDPNVSYLYAQFYAGYRQSGSWQQMATAAEKFLTRRPGDLEAIKAATEAYQKLGNTQKLVDFGTKLYAQAPNANTAYFLAKTYQSMKDGPNFLKWAERTVKHDPENIEMQVELIGLYWGANNLAQAAAAAEKVLKVVETFKKPEGMTDEQWKAKSNQIRGFAYRALGEKAYTANDLGAAFKHFDNAVKYDKKNDFGHYRLGFIYWRGGKTDEAIMCFARAFVLEGPSSSDARTQLYQLYGSTHKGTSGVAQILQVARQEVKQ